MRGCLINLLKVVGVFTILVAICGLIIAYFYAYPTDRSICPEAVAAFDPPQPVSAAMLTFPDVNTNSLASITIDNAGLTQPVQQYGRGYAQEVFWDEDDNLMVISTTGLWRHNAGDWESAPNLVWSFDVVGDRYQLSEDKSLLAVYGDGAGISIIDLESGQMVSEMSLDVYRVEKVAFNSDNSLLAAATFSDVHVWDVESGELESILVDDNFSLVQSVAFSPDDQYLAVGGSDYTRERLYYGAIRVWDMTSGEKITDIDTGKTGAGEAIAYDPTGAELASGSTAYYFMDSLQLWNPVSGQKLAEWSSPDRNTDSSGGMHEQPLRLKFSPEGRYLVYGSYLWKNAGLDTPTEMNIFRVHFNHNGTLIAGLSSNRDEAVSVLAQYAFNASKGNIRIWNSQSQREIAELPSYYSVAEEEITDVLEQILWQNKPARTDMYTTGSSIAMMYPTGDRLAVSWNGIDVDFLAPAPAVRVCDLTTGQRLKAYRLSTVWRIDDILVSPTEDLIAVDTSQGIVLIDTTDNSRHWLTRETVEQMAFSSDGSVIAAGTMDIRDSRHGDMKIILWNVETHEEIMRLEGHTAPLEALTFNADDTLLISYGQDGTVRLWGVPNDVE